MKSNFIKPINIGSEEMVSINELVKLFLKFQTGKLQSNI